jgi:multimeric flavodoxin WrbA
LAKITAIFGSPRPRGNSSRLLQKAVAGARAKGADVIEVVLRNTKISPCLEIYGCKKEGHCVIQDDFHHIIQAVLCSDGLMLASPLSFHTVSAHTKIFMDRCQSLWVKKYWIDGIHPKNWTTKRKGLFISVGATREKKLFDGALLTVKYFFDVLDTELSEALLFGGLESKRDVLRHPEMLAAAFHSGQQLAQALIHSNISFNSS